MSFASIAASEARVGSLISRGDGANVPLILLAAWAGGVCSHRFGMSNTLARAKRALFRVSFLLAAALGLH